MKKFTLPLLAGALMFSAQSHAQAIDPSANFGEFIDVARYFAVFVGLIVFTSGIYGFYTWSNTKGQGATPGRNFMKLIVGALLVISPWVYEFVKASLGVDNSSNALIGDGARMILAIDPTLGKGAATTGFLQYMPEGTFKAILGFVMFIGFIAFISGIYSLKDIHNSAGGAKAAPIMGPTLRIVGGIGCMNILWVGCFLGSMVGISALCAN